MTATLMMSRVGGGKHSELKRLKLREMSFRDEMRVNEREREI